MLVPTENKNVLVQKQTDMSGAESADEQSRTDISDGADTNAAAHDPLTLSRPWAGARLGAHLCFMSPDCEFLYPRVSRVTSACSQERRDRSVLR